MAHKVDALCCTLPVPLPHATHCARRPRARRRHPMPRTRMLIDCVLACTGAWPRQDAACARTLVIMMSNNNNT